MSSQALVSPSANRPDLVVCPGLHVWSWFTILESVSTLTAAWGLTFLSLGLLSVTGEGAMAQVGWELHP